MREDGLEALAEGAEHVVTSGELRERLGPGRPLRVKLGVDPTARDITLGWAVPLRKLRQFQDAGHLAVLVVGDFTARIGDPSGKSETRPQLTKEAVLENANACVEQLTSILSKDNLEVRHNSEWLEDMNLGSLLWLTASYTVAQLLEREDFSKRHREQRPISMVEFMYPLLQAYDSVAVEADVELGGTDQLFNLLVGRDIQRDYGQAPQVVMTMPLLEGLDGVQKMSQSLGNYVGIGEPPVEIFGKIMSISDDLVGRYGRLATDLDAEELAAVEAAATGGGPDAGRAKRRVARAIVELYHGPDAARAAEEAFDRQFKRHEVPEDLPEVDLPPGAVSEGVVHLPTALVAFGLASSRSEARRLISQGGVRVDGVPVAAEDLPLAELAGAVLQVGKRRFVRVL